MGELAKLSRELVAPCGMDCALCSAYLALRHGLEKRKGMTHCRGCRARNKMCAFIKKRCSLLRKAEVEFCFECPEFPCGQLEKLDARYQRDYDYSFIDNLRFIKENGIDDFLKMEQARYRCNGCGEVRSVHNGKCYVCETITTWRG